MCHPSLNFTSTQWGRVILPQKRQILCLHQSTWWMKLAETVKLQQSFCKKLTYFGAQLLKRMTLNNIFHTPESLSSATILFSANNHKLRIFLKHTRCLIEQNREYISDPSYIEISSLSTTEPVTTSEMSTCVCSLCTPLTT